MKQIMTLLLVCSAGAAALLLTSCGGSSEAEQADAYFEPLPFDRQVEPPAAPTPPPIFSPAVNPTIVRLIREQNDRIRDLMREIEEITDRKELVAESMAHADSVGEMLAKTDTIPDEKLLALMEDQNQGLDSAVQQMHVAAKHHVQVQHQLELYRESEYTPQRGPKPKVTYAQALQFCKEQDYAKAASAFQALLNGGVQRELADDCYFWLGVSQFQIRNLSDAVRGFTRVLEFRMSKRREAAYLMLGQCYEQLGSPKLAKATFEGGIREFPEGQLRHLAERKLELLN